MSEIERAVEEDVREKQSNKWLYIMVAVIIVGFAGFFIYTNFFSSPTGAVVTIDDLHEQNIDGKLSQDEGYMYNGFSFVNFDGLWYTKIIINEQPYSIPLHFGPIQVENVTVGGEVSENFNKYQDIYIAIDPLAEDSDYTALAASELAQNMAAAIKRRPVGACTVNETATCTFRPIVSCDTTERPIIQLLQEPGPDVELDDNCITLRGQGYDLVRAVDALLFLWYGIQ